jgi:hypothetical protein
MKPEEVHLPVVAYSQVGQPQVPAQPATDDLLLAGEKGLARPVLAHL